MANFYQHDENEVAHCTGVGANQHEFSAFSPCIQSCNLQLGGWVTKKIEEANTFFLAIVCR